MKEENKEVSRRDFLTKGAAVASIIAIPSVAATGIKAAEGKATRTLANDPVFTESTQTLTNKTIRSVDNTLGTDYTNVKEHFPVGTTTDITVALDAAINFLKAPGTGGQILIPRGDWTTKGGHDLVAQYL